MNVFSFFLLLFALMAALAKSWRYCVGFVVAAFTVTALPAGLDYLTTQPTTAREVLTVCQTNRDAKGRYDVGCVLAVWENLPHFTDSDGNCVYDKKFFATDVATIDPRFTGELSYDALAIMATEWLEAHPEQLDLAASSAIGNAIASRFPCPANPS